MRKKKNNLLKKVSTEELLAELNSRLKSENENNSSCHHSPMYEEEISLEEISRKLGQLSFEEWLKLKADNETKEEAPCPKCGRLTPVKVKKRKRTLHALHGTYSYSRNYHYCDFCKYGFYPLDEMIGAPQEGEATEAMTKRALDFAVNSPYSEASERFEMHYGRSISTNFLHCMVERCPLPEYIKAPKIEKSNRITIQIDGCHLPMKSGWKEAKLGVITQEEHHHKGSRSKKERGLISEASYVATMKNVDGFEKELAKVIPEKKSRLERKAGNTGKEVVWVGDGAPWIWNMQMRLCPHAQTILDYFHAVEHGTTCGKELLNLDKDCCHLWELRIKQLLDSGQIQLLIQELEECINICRFKKHMKIILKLIKYYKTNRSRMNYPEHKLAGRVIGSGIVESGHRHVLQSRMKKAGQHWSKEGAEKMARLRAVYRTVGPTNFFDKVYAYKKAA